MRKKGESKGILIAESCLLAPFWVPSVPGALGTYLLMGVEYDGAGTHSQKTTGSHELDFYQLEVRFPHAVNVKTTFLLWVFVASPSPCTRTTLHEG